MDLRRYSSLLILFLLALGSCHKDVEESDTRILENRPPELIDGIIVGTNTDEFGNSINQMDVDINGEQFETQNNPWFLISTQDMNSNGTVVTTTDANGMNHYQTIFPHPNDVNYTRTPHYLSSDFIQFDDNNTTSFDFSNGGSVSFPSDASLLNGSDYSGNIRLIGHSYDLTNTIHLNSLPGGQLAKDQNNAEKILTIYEALYIEMRSDGNESLRLKSNKSISAQFAVGNNLPNNFIGELALYHYNEDTHVWEFSTPVNSITNNSLALNMAGHWCIASAHDYIKLSGQLTTNNNPIANHEIQLSWFNDQTKRITFSTNKGNWFAFVPKDEYITVKANSFCGDLLAEGSSTNKVEDFAMGNLEIPSTDQISLIQGKARDCMDNLLANNIIMLTINNLNSIYFSEIPDFNFYVGNCGQENLHLQIGDLISQEFGANVSWDAKDEINVHNMYACEAAKQEYLTLRIEGDKKIYWSPSSKIEGGSRATLFVEDLGNPDIQVEIYVPHETTGIQPVEILNILLNDPEIGDRGVSLYCPTSNQGCGFEVFEMTHYGETSGEWIRGYFEGRFWMKNLDPSQAGYKNMNGDFQIFREF